MRTPRTRALGTPEVKLIKKVAIISLSSGILGEPFVQHEVKIGMKRLHDYGLEVATTENALKGMAYLSEHPESRAEDLLNALKDKSVDMILCAIGGDDTYRLLPYLFENNELTNAVKDNKKIFLGYSTSKYFEELIRTGTIKEIRPNEYWYEERKSFDEFQIGVPQCIIPFGVTAYVDTREQVIRFEE